MRSSWPKTPRTLAPKQGGGPFVLPGAGGRTDLVAVEDGKAYVRLSGGCTARGMAAVRLSQGI